MRRRMQASHGAQLQSPWTIPTAAVSLHVFGALQTGDLDAPGVDGKPQVMEDPQ